MSNVVSRSMRKATSVVVLATMFLGFISPGINVFANTLAGSTFTATQTVANYSTTDDQTATMTIVVPETPEVKASRTIRVVGTGNGHPDNGETMVIGSCVITFANIASSELDCSDNVATVKRASASGVTLETKPAVAGRLRSLTNLSDPNHGLLALSGSGPSVTITTAGTETSATEIITIDATEGDIQYDSSTTGSGIQINTLTIGGSIDVGDTFTAFSNAIGNVPFVATTTNPNDVAAGLNLAIQADAGYPNSDYTTSVAGNVITFTAKEAGNGFPSLTSFTTNASPVAQIVTFIPDTVVHGLTFRATLNGVNYDFTPSDSQTLQDAVEGLQSLMDTAPNVTCTEDDVLITCTADVPGVPFTFDANVVDITAPVISTDAPVLTVGPVTADGATVSYANPTAVDILPTNPIVVCAPASGFVFPLGETTINCSATDDAGNTGTQNFSVTIVDAESPVLSLPENITREVVSPSSEIVNFSVSAADNVDAELSISCDHVSGESFPIGTTMVSCSVTDTAGNTASGSFTITVQDTVAPTVSVSMGDTALKIGDTSLVTFTFSETPVSFDASDVTVENGTLGEIFTDEENPKIQYATFTPNTNVEDSENIVTVGTDWSDAASNAPETNTTSANYTVDTRAPTLSIFQAEEQSDPTNNPALLFTAVFSENINAESFSCSNVIVTNGVCTSVGPNGESMSSFVVNVTAGGPGNVTASPSSGENSITDVAGNPLNTEFSSEVDNRVTYTPSSQGESGGGSSGGGGSIIPPGSSNNSSEDDGGEFICKGPNPNGNWYRKCDMSTNLSSGADFAQNLICEGFIPAKKVFHYSSPIKRIEVAQLVVNMSHVKSAVVVTNSFGDVKTDIINNALGKKLINPLRPFFEPQRNATRSEAYSMIMSSVCMINAPTGQESNWQRRVFGAASDQGLTNKVWSEFNGNGSITQEEVYMVAAKAADWAETTGGCNPKPASCIPE